MNDIDVDKELAELANTVANEIDSEVIIYNGPMDDGGLGRLLQIIPEVIGARKGCMMILVTYGGLAGPAFRISRLMQDLFDPFSLFISGPCKSAGTLLAAGAHKLYMFPHSGELGPLDVQLFKRDEIGERRSGLITKSAIESLGQHAFELFSYFMMEAKSRSGGLTRFKIATEMASLITTGLVSQIFQKIDPDTVGEEHRDTLVAYAYAARLLTRGKNITEAGVHKLVYDYPSHDFVIDYLEALDIFNAVERPSPAMVQLVRALGAEAMTPGNAISVRRLSTSASVGVQMDGSQGANNGQAAEKADGNRGSNGEAKPSGDVGNRRSRGRKGNRRPSAGERRPDGPQADQPSPGGS